MQEKKNSRITFVLGLKEEVLYANASEQHMKLFVS